LHLLETLRIFAETDRQVSFFSCKNMNEEVNKIIEVMVQQIMNHVPDYGDFSPILEFFVNPDSRTSEFVGKYGLKVYKMPKDIVADPRIRYIEAAAYIPSGIYKSDCTVASGTKDEIIATMQASEFAEKLQETFLQLAELFEHYD